MSVLSSTFQSLPLPECDVNPVSGFSFEKNRIANPVSGQYVLYIEQENSKIKICDNYIMADLLPVELFENQRKITDSEQGSINIYDNIIVNQSDEGSGFDSENELSSGSGMKCSSIHGKSASESDGAIEIINNAGYRKKIKNYGDII